MARPAIDGYLKNEIDCYIVGSGPSLRGFDFSRLHNKFTIALNHTIEFFPTANCLLFADKAFLQHTSYDITQYPGLIFASQKIEHYPPLAGLTESERVYIFNDNKESVTTRFDKGLFHPTSAGALAINLALIMGARKIYLLGYDFKFLDGNMHFYPDKPHHKTYGEDRTIRKIEKFNKFLPMRKNIFNLNKDSNLKAFFFADPQVVV